MPHVETLHQSKWLGLFRIEDWDFARRPGGDLCVGILATTGDDEILLVEQFRVPVQKRVIEIPAGLVGDEEEHRGEPIEETARRELLEETGYRAAEIRPLIASPTSAGMTSEITHLFHATGLIRETNGGGTGGENITVHRVPLRELRGWLAAKETQGFLIDYKIHAALWAAGISPG
jgi:ADP-ribose pyrophosphatase